MAGKGKRVHHGGEEDPEGKSEPSGDIQVLMRLLIESNSRAEAERRAERIEAEKREEEREIRRNEAKAVRKRDEAKALEELEKQKEEAARVASERMREQQQEAEERAYEHQRNLAKLQAEIGVKAEEARRMESEKGRRRDRAVAGIPSYRDSEDIEDYLLTSERKLRTGDVPEEEWVQILASKLGGKVGSTWQDLCMLEEGYQGIKAGLLKVCGYTPKLAGEVFFGFKQESMKGMSADQLWHRGVQLLRRMVAPSRLPADIEFAIMKCWIWSVVPRRARILLDSRVVTSSGELIGALQDRLVLEGERSEGQVAVFKRQAQGHENNGSNGSSEKKVAGACFKCGKPGHKAADCWQKGGATVPGSSKPTASQGGSSGKGIVCYTCGEEGHKSTQCTKIKREKVNPKEGQPKPVRQLWHREERDTVLDGVVNGVDVSVLLDSGASISIVPEDMVGQELRTGEFVLVTGFQSKVPIRLPTAKVMLKIDHLEWEELVALAPVVKGKEREVLCGLNFKTERGLQLVLIANKEGQSEVVSEVVRVVTRAEARREASEKKGDEKIVALEKPKVKAVKPVVPTVVSGVGRPGEGGSVADRPAGTPKPGPAETVESDQVSERQEELAEDRPAGEPLSVRKEIEASLAEERDDEMSLAEDSSAEEEDLLSEEEMFCVRPKGREKEDLVIPPVKPGSSSRAELVNELKSDPSVANWRTLADREEQGFCWADDLLYQAVTTHTLEVAHLMVLPTKFRKKVMTLAHERGGHLGARKVKALVKQRFVWPEMAKDIVKHCQSCEVCQRCKKTKSRRVPLIEREVLSEPFEVLAMDLVGPFPKGKGGYTHLLTAICMSSKWPEAIPLKSVTTKAVAEGMVEIFARTGIPLQLLTDQGSQFVGYLVAHLCRDLHIDKVKTAPYHPECNGVVERMHGTLGAMLTKAAALGLDWVGQVPFALFALRSSPNRDTQFSPFQLVYGHSVRTPLDILHQGWAEVAFQDLDTEEWSDWLVARLESWHDVLRDRGEKASVNRKKLYDKGAMERTLVEGDLVLCRVPGMTKKLKESWHGPYEVVKAMNRVDYKVKLRKGRSKVLHINNLKKYHPRGEEVLRLAVVAEDCEEDDVIGSKLSDACVEFDRGVVEDLKKEYPEVFSDSPGKTKVVKLRIKTGDAEPRVSHPHRVPDKLKEGARVEIMKLVKEGIAVPSCSPWASPIVPVPKKDGTVRICVDFRRLNEVTVGDPFYMTTLEEILERVGSSRCMSKLDLAKGFYQVEVEAQSREKTAFVCPFGKFEFTRMPFGLKNAPALFQRCMEVVLQKCYSFSAPYIDDVLIFSEGPSEHASHLRQVVQELSRHGMTVKESKCMFGMKKVEYLGHVIGRAGSRGGGGGCGGCNPPFCSNFLIKYLT